MSDYETVTVEQLCHIMEQLLRAGADCIELDICNDPNSRRRLRIRKTPQQDDCLPEPDDHGSEVEEHEGASVMDGLENNAATRAPLRSHVPEKANTHLTSATSHHRGTAHHHLAKSRELTTNDEDRQEYQKCIEWWRETDTTLGEVDMIELIDKAHATIQARTMLPSLRTYIAHTRDRPVSMEEGSRSSEPPNRVLAVISAWDALQRMNRAAAYTTDGRADFDYRVCHANLYLACNRGGYIKHGAKDREANIPAEAKIQLLQWLYPRISLEIWQRAVRKRRKVGDWHMQERQARKHAEALKRALLAGKKWYFLMISLGVEMLRLVPGPNRWIERMPHQRLEQWTRFIQRGDYDAVKRGAQTVHAIYEKGEQGYCIGQTLKLEGDDWRDSSSSDCTNLISWLEPIKR